MGIPSTNIQSHSLQELPLDREVIPSGSTKNIEGYKIKIHRAKIQSNQYT